MEYATYEFYTNKYYGDSIEEADFDKWLSKAQRIMDRYTYNRLTENFPENEKTIEQVGLCACDLAEKLVEIDKYLKASGIRENGETIMVKSKTAGSESVTFATGETVYAELVKDNGAMERFYCATVKKYLAGYEDRRGVNLVYAGV